MIVYGEFILETRKLRENLIKPFTNCSLEKKYI